MKYTENYNLKKPEATDSYNVDDFNENMDTVDAEIAELKNPSYEIAETLSEPETKESYTTFFGKVKKAIKDFISHLANTANPHSVTYSQIGAAASKHSHEKSDVDGLTDVISNHAAALLNLSKAIGAQDERLSALEEASSETDSETVEDISDSFISSISDYMDIQEVSVCKQGNVISGCISVIIGYDEPADAELELTIAEKYKAAHIVCCPTLWNGNFLTTHYFAINEDTIYFSVTNSVTGTARFSFSFICE